MSNVVATRLSAIRDNAHIKSTDIANMLGVRPETVSRWNQGKSQPRANEERLLYVVEYIAGQLSEVYEPREARAFFYAPQRLLGGKSPADLIQAGEQERVMELVRQIVDGVHV